MSLIETLQTPFVWRALLGGLAIALITGPLGVFIVWRRMAYFGDTLAHSGLLGVCLGFLLGLSPTTGVLIVCLTLAALLAFLQARERLAADTLLGLLAHTALALGLVALTFLETLRFDLTAFLFGDLLAIDNLDLLWVWGGGSIALIVLIAIWKPLLAATVDEALARAEGVPTGRAQAMFTLLVAMVIACAIKIVGVLLITALLIIPAATAQRLARSPEQMAVFASATGIVALFGGIAASLTLDTPAAASVVTCATLLFALSRIIPVRH
ncbi:MAG: metal ABC transporter permease [Proteobacteria bacterium]|nr:metal ABC transporter permease [Pseudomonadota bacterium]MCL2308176.1 metal ABC transporter permease [Pseudomonadota bacterium]